MVDSINNQILLTVNIFPVIKILFQHEINRKITYFILSHAGFFL